MLRLTTSVTTFGQLPEPYTLDDMVDRSVISGQMVEIYRSSPNLVARLESSIGPIVVKWFGWRHPIHRMLSPTFPGRAQTSWDIAHALKNAGSRTPEPCFVCTRRQRGFIEDNFFVTEAIHPHRRFRPLLKSDVPVDFLVAAAIDLAKSIARMHSAGIFHRDLTTANFLVNDEAEVYTVDLNRALIFPKLSVHQRLTDLAKLSFKARDRECGDGLMKSFFSTYADEGGGNLDWESGYRDYRKALLSRRRWKRTLRRPFR